MKRKLHTMIATLLIAGLAVGCGKSAAQKKAEKEQKITDVFEGAEAKECETKAKEAEDAVDSLVNSVSTNKQTIKLRVAAHKVAVSTILSVKKLAIKIIKTALENGGDTSSILPETKKGLDSTKEAIKEKIKQEQTPKFQLINTALQDNGDTEISASVIEKYIDAFAESLFAYNQLIKKAIEIK